MAYTLKVGHSLTNPYDPASPITSAYGIVDDVGENKQRKQIRFDLVIYNNRNARANGSQPLASFTVVVSDSIPVLLLNGQTAQTPFTTYFGQSLSTSVWSQIQTYLVAAGLPLPLNINDWQLDGQAEP